MKRFSLLHPPLLSFYSRALYRDVARNWTEVAFLYLFLLLAVAWIPSILALHRTLTVLVDQFGPALFAQIPALSIRNGEVSLEAPQPYTIRIPGTGVPLAIIDTTGRTTPLSRAEAFILVTRNQLVVRHQNRPETRVYDLHPVREFSLDRTRVEGWSKIFKSWFALVVYPFALFGSYAYRIVQVLLYAALGMIFAKVLHADLAYPALVRLAVISVTPVIVLDTLRSVSPGWLPYWGPTCFFLAMAYLLFAVRVNSPSGSADSPDIPG